MIGVPRGRFITFEGGEGAGKSVQARRLETKLKALGLEVVRTREPGGSPHAEKLREAILSGFAAPVRPGGRSASVRRRPDRPSRQDDPAGAGAGRMGRLRPLRRLLPAPTRASPATCRPPLSRASRKSSSESNRPDLTLVLDVPAEAGLERARARRGTRSADRFEAEGLKFHETLRRAFLDIAAAEPERCVVVDALRSEEGLAGAVWALVQKPPRPQRDAEAERVMKMKKRRRRRFS